MTDRILQKVFYDPQSPAYMAGTTAVWREAKKRGTPVTLKKVKEYLLRQKVYTLHKPVRKRFKRAKTTGVALSSHVQIDLVDLRSLTYHNNRYSWILFCIDCFSRQLRAVPIKSKKSSVVMPALKQAIESFPNTVWTVLADSGTEFESDVRRYIEDAGMEFVQLVNSPHKASMVERVQRTIMTRVAKHMTHSNSKRWIDILPILVDNYNNSHHRIIGRSPNSITPKNEGQVYQQLYGQEEESIKYAYKTGDRVRAKTKKTLMSKGYSQTFTRDIFEIVERVPGRQTAAYRVRNADSGQPVTGIWYESELVKAGTETGPRKR